ncbi:hypothetical protein ACIA8O_08575 [Kitasatospora sp. NPDC051853]|uniref:hypothetical protein n=1 Tax=Kitasatospora sp. NPDC051853 TaxID=3364058 RepID=UPI0037B82CD5
MPDGRNAGVRLVELFRQVCEPDEFAEEALTLAGAHLDRAEDCDAAVTAHGVLISGTRGTLVANPAVAEARRERAAAWAIVKTVMPDPEQVPDGLTGPDRSAAARAMARARWGVRGGPAA